MPIGVQTRDVHGPRRLTKRRMRRSTRRSPGANRPLMIPCRRFPTTWSRREDGRSTARSLCILAISDVLSIRGSHGLSTGNAASPENDFLDVFIFSLAVSVALSQSSQRFPMRPGQQPNRAAWRLQRLDGSVKPCSSTSMVAFSSRPKQKEGAIWRPKSGRKTSAGIDRNWSGKCRWRFADHGGLSRKPCFPIDEQRNRPAGALVVGQTPRFRTIRRSFRQQYQLHAIAQILRPNFVVWTFYVRPARFYDHTTAGPDC